MHRSYVRVVICLPAKQVTSVRIRLRPQIIQCMEYHWKDFLDESEYKDEEWRQIPSDKHIYLMSRSFRVIRFCKYKGKRLYPHFIELSTSEGRVDLGRHRIGIKELHAQLFGISHYDTYDSEKWVDIKGFEGLYQISDKGNIRSYPKTIVRKNGVPAYIHERIIKPTSINSGYKIINLHKDGELYHFLIHRLVALHFIPNPNGYEFVNHKDEDKHNNVVSNLEWCTKTYNNNYGTCQQRRVESRRRNNGGKYR